MQREKGRKILSAAYDNYLQAMPVGPYGISPYYMEAKIGQAEAMKAAKQVILAAVRGGRGRIPSDLRAQS